jgi:Flp pilus assembly pilin Flp
VLDPRRSRGRRRDDGAAAVEFALLFPVFVMITFGMISAGITISRQVNISQAAREAARYGATLSFASAGGSVDDWLQKVQAAAVSAAGGDVDAAVGSRYVCVAYVGGSSATKSLTLGGGGPASGSPCYDDSASVTGAHVQVVVRRESDINGVLFSFTTHVSGRAVTPYEAT